MDRGYHGGFMSAAARSERLRALLAERIVVLDGATGTYIQGRDLTARDFGGPEYEGCNEHLVLTRPDVIRDMHEGYLAAGADIVETDTFGGTRIVLGEYGLQDKVREINATAARLARAACARFETPDRPRLLLPDRRPPRRGGTVQRDAGVAGHQGRAFLRRGLGEHHRRLLRHDGGAHPAPRRAGAAPPATERRARPAHHRLRDRGASHRRRPPPGGGGRAHERDREPQVQGAGRRRRPRPGGRGRTPPGARRRAGARRLPRQPRPRRADRPDRLPGRVDAKSEGPAHARLHRRARPRGGPQALPGESHRQLDQPGGRRGPLPEG